jgi:hypothetical protein
MKKLFLLTTALILLLAACRPATPVPTKEPVPPTTEPPTEVPTEPPTEVPRSRRSSPSWRSWAVWLVKRTRTSPA